MKQLDYQDIFKRLPEPVAICDENGFVLSLNHSAERFLGPIPGKRLRLIITSRETVRQMRMDQGLQEFFLAEVRVENASRTTVSLSLLELESGGFRVAFAQTNQPSSTPGVQLLESIININRHLPLFKKADKIVALFASSFGEVFPEYGFTLVVHGSNATEYRHRAWDAEFQEVAIDEMSAPLVTESEFHWSGTSRGYRLDMHLASGLDGYLQIERQADKKFSVGEREAFETFAQQLGFAISRLKSESTNDEVSVVAPIIDQLDAVVIVCDSRRRIRVANRTFESLVNDSDVVGRDILEFFAESSQTKLRTSAASVMGSGGVESFDAALVNSMGTSSSQVILKMQVAPNRAGHDATSSTNGFIITGQTTEMSIVELEERLSRAEHLMNLGQLATGVAHELKNPLTSILNYADYLLRKYDDSVFEERDRHRLRRIIEGVEHIDAFVHDLMTLARPNEGEWGELDVHRVIKESAALAEVQLSQNQVTTVFSFGEPALIHGAHGQISQVFVNLFTNAANAMKNGGHIHVSTLLQDGFVVCAVEDDAGGMAPEVVEQIFEPFFTTRDQNGGTGLGLAIVREIVNRHRGRIEVDSELGRGTCFTLWLPEVE